MAGGRPPKYKAEFAEQAYKLCLLGAIDKELADFFEVNEATINRWKTDHKEFCKSLKKGKTIADAEMAASLFHRGRGYSHPDIHISNYQGIITQTPIIKHYPPDPTSAIFWLKNRQKDKWRDKHDIEHSGHTKNTIDMSVLTVEELKKLANLDTGDEEGDSGNG